VPRARGRRDHLEVIPIAEHATASPMRPIAERGVDVLGRGDLKALHTAGERDLALRLDEQVDVRALEAEVDDANALAARGRDRGVAHRLVHRSATQAPHRGHDAKHDVERVERLEVGARSVRRDRTRTGRLATSAGPLTTATKQLLLSGWVGSTPRSRRRHDWSVYSVSCEGDN
jgi:hypothetical protein